MLFFNFREVSLYAKIYIVIVKVEEIMLSHRNFKHLKINWINIHIFILIINNNVIHGNVHVCVLLVIIGTYI